jgi:hypothetical protein
VDLSSLTKEVNHQHSPVCTKAITCFLPMQALEMDEVERLVKETPNQRTNEPTNQRTNEPTNQRTATANDRLEPPMTDPKAGGAVDASTFAMYSSYSLRFPWPSCSSFTATQVSLRKLIANQVSFRKWKRDAALMLTLKRSGPPAYKKMKILPSDHVIQYASPRTCSVNQKRMD